jgi:hypothetical protein
MERTTQQQKAALRKKVRMLYDVQRVRMQLAGRVNRAKEHENIQLYEVDKIVLERWAKSAVSLEKEMLKEVEGELKKIPYWVEHLSNKDVYYGIGPKMAAVILSEFDIEREETVSQMWAFAGLSVQPARKCGLCHAVVKKDGSHYERKADRIKECKKCKATLDPEDRYEKDGKIHCGACDAEIKTKKCPGGPTYEGMQRIRLSKGKKSPYNKFLKTKLVGVLADVLIKKKSEKWTKFYYDYKHRKKSAGWGVSDRHRDNAARGYMIKMLLKHIYVEWRTFEGLPVREPYQEQYLHHKHHEHEARAQA